MRYYTLQQLPNFLFALPVWSLSAAALVAYVRQDVVRFCTAGIWSKQLSANKTADGDAAAATFFSSRLLPYVYLWSGLFLVCLTILHGRFLSAHATACRASATACELSWRQGRDSS